MAVPFDELNRQNREIEELCKVLAVLIQDRSMCDTTIVCELFDRFSDKVRTHMELQDRTLYASLLTHRDKKINATAVRSLNGAKEIKRIFLAYTSTWCRHGLDVFDHGKFVRETLDIFRLVTDRVRDEVDNLYPLAQDLGDRRLARSA